MHEIWKDIDGFAGLYKISNLGRIKSFNRSKGKILKPLPKLKGYLYIHLSKAGKAKPYRIHRLVAEHFVDNPFEFPQVNHKDGNKANNTAENLEWCNGSMNQIHASNSGLRKDTIAVAMYSKEGVLLGVFKSRSDASRKTGAWNQSISKCCRGELKSTGGYVWKNATPEQERMLDNMEEQHETD